jgi:flagellin
MTVINTNIAASVTANAMKENQRTMENTMERLATGRRINSASDDAAGLAIGTKMESQIRGLSQAVRNANEGISMIQTADGAAVEIGDMLQRMRELSVQAQNGTNAAADLINLNKEFAALATEIDRVADDTTYNNVNVLNGKGDVSFNIGADQSDDLTVTFTDFNLAAGQYETHAIATVTDLSSSGAALTFSEGVNSVTVSSATHANAAAQITALQGATGYSDLAFEVSANNGSAGLKWVAKNIGDYQGTVASTGSGTATKTDGTAMVADLSSYKTAAGIAQAAGTIAALDNAIAGVAAQRADFGAAINTLEYTVDNLNNAVQNTAAAKSAIMDADYAAETTELARTQIISQASTAMLSQANQQAQSVLALLK